MWPLKKNKRVEDPDRLKRFLEVLSPLDWQNAPKESLEKTFSALNDLVYHEILFYYRARKNRRKFSIITRGSAVLLGTLGVLSPLLAGADPDLFKHLAAYGYPLLAAAASMLLINRLFGATGGHIRYVTAQLELERALTTFRLEWAEWAAQTAQESLSTETRAQAFQLFRRFSDLSYNIIQEETNVWGKSVSEALQEYSNYISDHTKGLGPAKHSKKQMTSNTKESR